MAAALVGQALLSESVKLISDKIASQEFRRFIKNRKLNLSLLDKLRPTLLSLDALLIDAEEQQITNKKIREWLEELKDAIMDAEDLLDRISTEDLRRKEEAKYTYQVQQVFASINLNPWKMNSKVEALLQRLELFASQKETLGLKNSLGRRVSHRTTTSSVVNKSAVMIGRDDDKEKLMNFLLSDDANNNSIGVITIVGMGGVGKTTLAQLLYNDQRVKEHFNLKAWACVSEVFDAALVTKTLLESVASKPYETKNLDLPQNELKQTLNNKKFLFVLDDLWNDKYNEWDELRTPFSWGKQGSKIIITTRQEEVARMTRTFPIHYLAPLSHEDCWSLLAQHAFENGDHSRCPNLEVIGKKIAAKCGGLPIAAKTLGGILRFKVDESEWNDVLNSNIWELPNGEVLPALWLSYLYLPSHLKRCFAYCSIFPKDYPLDRKCIILLWMAEGLLQESQNKSMEKAGNEYFDELLSRSLIQKVGVNFVMHDLVNDLATIVSGKSCSRLESIENLEKLRHLSYQRGYYDSYIKFRSCYNVKHLRAFLPLSKDYMWHYLTERVSHDFLLRQRSLRVLSLANYKNIRDLPNSIGNLIHLRYLDLSYTSIKKLPYTIFKLYNLQTLRLLGCEKLHELPADIRKLVNLRHLDMTGIRLEKMSRQITRLENLRTLSTFVIGKSDDGLCVSDLRHFRELEGRLKILKLGNVVKARDAIEANLKKKELIEELVLGWGSTCSHGSEIETEVLELLQPSTNLRQLSIQSYNGTKFPKWLGDFSFSNVVLLKISNCKFCLNLPSLGQLPSLKELEVRLMDSVKTVGEEFYGYGSGSTSFQPFPSLESLSFEDMANWEEWLPFSGEGIEFPFPRLRGLTLDGCRKLRGCLPHHLPSSLTRVSIRRCDELELEATALSRIASIEDLSISDVGPHLLLPMLEISSNCLSSLYLHNIRSLTSFPTDGTPTLQGLVISRCKTLEFSINEACRNYSSLIRLTISNSCQSLTSFPLGCFPVLQNLGIYSSPNLKSFCISNVASAESLSSLQSITISNCPNLESFPQGGLCTPNLIQFWVWSCEKLESLPEGMDTLNALQRLDISRIPHLASFPQCGLPPNLINFKVGGCKTLGSLPERMDALNALQRLEIWGLPMLSSFPQGGLPPNLQSLRISDCGKLPPTTMAECIVKLHTSLSHCEFEGGDDLVKTLLKHRQLPNSLVSLVIRNLDNVEFLEGNGLQHLTSLEKLQIDKCSRLRYLPEDSPPPSLSQLTICNCPLLSARYKKGKHRSKIGRVPTIEIDGEVTI